MIPRRPQRRNFGFGWFIPELVKHKRIFRDVLLASLAIQLMALATPLFTQAIIDKVIVHQTHSTLAVVGFALVMFMLFSTVMTWLRQYLVIHTGNRIDAVLGSHVFGHMLRLPLRYFEQRPIDAATGTFSGTSANGDVGALSIKVTAQDGSGVMASDVFNIAVANTNDAPVVANAVADQTATEDAAFSFVLPADTFADVDLIHRHQRDAGGRLRSAELAQLRREHRDVLRDSGQRRRRLAQHQSDRYRRSRCNGQRLVQHGGGEHQ